MFYFLNLYSYREYSRKKTIGQMFYFLNLYSYREYSRKKTIGFNFFNFFNSFNSKKLSECET